MARKRRRRELEDDIDEDLDEELDDEVQRDDDRTSRARRKPRTNGRRKFLVFLALLAALVAGGPTVVGKTPLRNLVLSSAVPSAAARVTTTAGAFSWLTGQSVAGVTIANAAGAPIATIESATIDRSLVALAANRGHLGKITITRPVIHLQTRVGGSNIEDLLAQIAEAAAQQTPAADAPNDSSTTLAEIEVIDGVILGQDTVTGQLWRMDGLALTTRPGATGAWDTTATGVVTLGAAPRAALAGEPTPAAGGIASAPSTLDAAPLPGRFKFQLTAAPAQADVAGAAATQHLTLLADQLPLAPLEPLLARLLPSARLTGTASTDLKIVWAGAAEAAGDGLASEQSLTLASTGGAGGFDAAPAASNTIPFTLSLSGKLDATDIRFTADAFSGDLVELPTAALAIDATLAGSQLTSRQFALSTPLAEAEATGHFDLSQLATLSPSALPTTDAMVTAHLDLPQLTRMLPRTLRLREGVRIDSGRVEITARSTAADAGRRWSIAGAVENLLGHDGTRAIRWNEPVEAAVDFLQVGAAPELKRIVLRAPSASLTAEGAAGGLEGQLAVDLQQLGAQLGQFVDLTAWQLRGTGQGTFSWRDTGPDKFAASAALDLRAIDVRREGAVVWLDPDVHLELQSTGLRLGAQPLRIDTLAALMRGPRDTLELELLEPVALAAEQRDWFVRVKGDGPLDSWAGRLRPWIASIPAELAGQSSISARVRLGGGLVEIAQSQVSIQDFRTRIAGVELVESRIEAGGDFRWDGASRALASQNLSLASSTVAASARGVDIRLTDVGPPTVRGEVAFRGDLERMAAWAGKSQVVGGMWPRGQAVGRMLLASDATRASATLTLKAEPFTLVQTPAALPGAAGAPFQSVSNPASGLQPPFSSLQPPTIAWHDPSLQLATELSYSHGDDRLQLTNLRLDGQTVKLSGAAAVDQFRSIAATRGEVVVAYDAAELAKLLTAYLGPGVRLTGTTPLRLIATGNLKSATPASSSTNHQGAFPSPTENAATHWSRRLAITAESGWTAADLYGLPIGPATLTANIRDGQIQFNPIDLAVGQGRLTAQPRMLLDPPPQALQLAAGPLLSRVDVSEGVSDAMLKYAAPILANATRASGTFSVITEGVQIPLDNPKSLRTNGRVTMHQLSILPGPGLADVVTLIGRIEQLTKSRENLLGALAQQPTQPAKGITIIERTIDVQIVDGRVYHRNLEFLVDDVPVSSYGSVGFDQTLDLVIRVPVQAKWVGRDAGLQRLVGQVIEIPVRGTMSRWNIDERAVAAFLTQAAQTAVGGVIENELNKALEGLFKRK